MADSNNYLETEEEREEGHPPQVDAGRLFELP